VNVLNVLDKMPIWQRFIPDGARLVALVALLPPLRKAALLVADANVAAAWHHALVDAAATVVAATTVDPALLSACTWPVASKMRI
jgi:hypothetical protein